MEYKEMTETIIGRAYRVYNKKGFGFLKNVYQKCLIIELKKASLDLEKEKPARLACLSRAGTERGARDGRPGEIRHKIKDLN